MEYCTRLAPQGWRDKHLDNPADSNQLSAEIPECPVEQKVQKSTWERLIKKSIALMCLSVLACGSEMKILAVIMDPGETEKILKDTWSKSVGRGMFYAPCPFFRLFAGLFSPILHDFPLEDLLGIISFPII